jgi:thioredoxin 1
VIRPLGVEKEGTDVMNKSSKLTITAILLFAVVAVIVAKQSGSRRGNAPLGNVSSENLAIAAYSPAELTGKGRPTLIDLGAGTCIPCKLMVPVLEDLKSEFEGAMDVHVLDVGRSPELVSLYGMRVMPTQIFYDGAGNELFRHEGFFSKEDILTKWKALGVDLSSKIGESSPK